TSDLVRVTGGTLASSSGLLLNLSDAGGFTNGTYTLFDFGGANATGFHATDFILNSTIAGYSYGLAVNGNQLQLTATSVSAIPEPGTSAAIFAACALGATAWIRRRPTPTAGQQTP